MKIDRFLNIVIPCETDNGVIHIHSTPISSAVFKQYYFVLSKCYSMFLSQDLLGTAPSISLMMLEDVSRVTMRLNGSGNWWDGPDGVENGLLNEVRRLTNVIVPVAGQGWQTIPFVNAVADGKLPEEDVADVESLLVFFTCLSAIPQLGSTRADMVRRIAAGLDWQVTPLNCTAWAAQLMRSTEAVNSGAMVRT